MKQILTIVFMLIGSTSFAQDTTGIMITLAEVIYLDYENGLEVTGIYPHNEVDLIFSVDAEEVLALHLYDDLAGMHRKITTTWLDDGGTTSSWFHSTDNVIYSRHGWGSMKVEISGPVLK
tara:strand:- start:267 stop:626 length:360 start_codon:yes stop_codon:yes gene_type:complete